MGLGGTEDNKNSNEFLDSLTDAGAQVANGLEPSNIDVDNSVTSEAADEFVANNPDVIPYVLAYLEKHPEVLENLAKKLSQNQPMMKKTISFGKMLAIAGISLTASVASGIIIGANLGAVGVGLGAVGVGLGAVGAGLAVAGPAIGFVLAGLAGLVAIAALGFAAYKYRGQIKSGMENIGKKVKHLLKNICDKLPVGVSNAQELYSNVANKDAQDRMNQGNPLSDDIALIGQYLLNKDGLAALRACIIDDPNKGKIILEGGTEVTLTDLERLEEKGKSKFESDQGKFIEVLKKFAPIMNKDNVALREQIEEKKDEIHVSKKRQTPLSSSTIYTDSVANNQFLALVSDDRRKDVKDFLQSIAGYGPELKGGLNKEFRSTFYNRLYEQNLQEIHKLEGKEGGNLTALAAELNNLSDNQIKDFNKIVSELKEEQARGPRKKLDGTGTSQAQEPSKGHDV